MLVSVRVITHIDVVAGVGRLSALYICVYVTVSTKPLDISPNVADG